MRSANNRSTTKSGPATPALWLPDTAPPMAARGSKPRPDRLADIALQQASRRADRHARIGARQPSLVGRHAERPHRDRPHCPVREAVQATAGMGAAGHHHPPPWHPDPRTSIPTSNDAGGRTAQGIRAAGGVLRAARRATVDERRYLSKIADSFMEAGATVDVGHIEIPSRALRDPNASIIACLRA